MGSRGGGGGRPGRGGGGGTSANRNDSGITAALRKEYEPHRVTVTQANGRTIMEHINGRIEIYDAGTKAVVQKPGGKRYNYNDVIKALGHFEDLGGFKT